MAVPNSHPTQADLPRIAIDSARFLGLSQVGRIARILHVALAERAYPPAADDPEADWVASIAAPAFARLAARRGPVSAFCALGTGAGVDALAGIEILRASEIGLTDLFPEVVEVAAVNVTGNLAPGTQVLVHAGAGDLLIPLAGRGLRFDVIYENLPNLPLSDDARLGHSRTSGAFLPSRTEPVPQLFKDTLLALHWVALVQARDFLAPGGAVLSTLGGRVPLAVFSALSELAGLKPELFAYAWKVQAEPDAVIGSYAAWQRTGLGPFHFYRADDLRRVFAGVDSGESGRRAAEIEHALEPYRLDAVTALEAHQGGERIGHTVAVLKSELRA